MSSDTIGLSDIQAAADNLRGQHIYTPILENEQLNRRLGGRVLFKAECLQRTGSFKFRGAYTKISQLSTEQRQRGIVAYSSGNHAQGVAAVAQMFDIPATIIMPSDAPKLKIQNTRLYDAQVVLYDRWKENREAIGQSLATKTDASSVLRQCAAAARARLCTDARRKLFGFSLFS